MSCCKHQQPSVRGCMKLHVPFSTINRLPSEPLVSSSWSLVVCLDHVVWAVSHHTAGTNSPEPSRGDFTPHFFFFSFFFLSIPWPRPLLLCTNIHTLPSPTVSSTNLCHSLSKASGWEGGAAGDGLPQHPHPLQYWFVCSVLAPPPPPPLPPPPPPSLTSSLLFSLSVWVCPQVPPRLM